MKKNTHTHIQGSLGYTAEVNTLQINYTSIQFLKN